MARVSQPIQNVSRSMPPRSTRYRSRSSSVVGAGGEVPLLDLPVLRQLAFVQREVAAQFRAHTVGTDDRRRPHPQQERIADRPGILGERHPGGQFLAAGGQYLVLLLLPPGRHRGGQRPDPPGLLQFSELAIDLLVRR